jgi:geranylgeranyl reductase family protein
MHNEEIWDAVVVGAGPAGCAAAYDLAHAGRRVLLVDKANFPRPKACAGGLTMRAVKALRYPVAPVVRRTVREIVLESDGAQPPSERALPVGRPKPLCVMTVREELDAYCLERTLEAGAEFRRIGGILAIEESADSVMLVAGEETRVTARYIVGADGVHSRVRALTDPAPAWLRRGFALEANVKIDPAAAPPLTFDFAPVRGGYGWLFPRHDHVNVGLYVYEAGRAHGLDRDALADYIEARSHTRDFYGFTGQFLGLGAGEHSSSAKRVLLVGDAGGFADPLTGEGIYGAIASGQAAAAAILDATQHATMPGTIASVAFARRTARLRGDLRVATAAARSFYAAPSRAFRLLGYMPVRQAAIQTFSHGSSITALAAGVRTLARLLPERTFPAHERSA